MRYSCFRLAENHVAKEEYTKAKQCAHTGLLVERYAYQPDYRKHLSDIVGLCHTMDAGLRAEYSRAALGPYPLE